MPTSTASPVLLLSAMVSSRANVHCPPLVRMLFSVCYMLFPRFLLLALLSDSYHLFISKHIIGQSLQVHRLYCLTCFYRLPNIINAKKRKKTTHYSEKKISKQTIVPLGATIGEPLLSRLNFILLSIILQSFLPLIRKNKSTTKVEQRLK